MLYFLQAKAHQYRRVEMCYNEHHYAVNKALAAYWQSNTDNINKYKPIKSPKCFAKIARSKIKRSSA